MGDFGLIIKKPSINKDVEDCAVKELVFHSSYACAKIIQAGRYDFEINTGNTTEYEVTLDAVVDFPLVVLAFMYDPSDSTYKAMGGQYISDFTQNYRGRYQFDSSKLYLGVENYTGSTITSHIIYFICYA